MQNSVNIMGRLTSAPELKMTQAGKEVCAFCLACERDVPGQDGQRQADFIDVVAWGGTASFAAKYFAKGQLMALTGRLQARSWEDRQGSRRKTVEVVAERIYFAGVKGGDNGKGRGAGALPTPFDTDLPSGEFAPLDNYDEDLPF